MEVNTTIHSGKTTVRELKEFIDLIYSLAPDGEVDIIEIPQYIEGRYGYSEKDKSSLYKLTTSIKKTSKE